jgi:hypothetical protein
MSARKKPSKPPAAPVNISQLARDHGVSRETIRKLRTNGIDLSDDKAVCDGLAASKAQAAAPAPTDGSESLLEAKRRRAIADADRAEVIARRESGEVIAVADVEELMTRLGAEMRSRLLSWIGTLPPQLEGLDAARIQRLLREKITDLLTSIHENSPIKSKP